MVRPDKIEDLIAMNALYRPGPMSSNAHTDFALIKRGEKEPTFDYMLEGVTKKTNGLYIYQEQIMQAVVVLGGLSLVESDNLRTAIKKFLKDVMLKYEQKFLKGAQEKGCSKEEAEAIWKKLQAFSGYGFNRSHSAAYSLMAYWSQWLKLKYPLEFWTSTLNFSSEGEIPFVIDEMKKVSPNVTIRTPDINKSTYQFECSEEENSVFYSLLTIKGIGIAKVDAILKERGENGEFFGVTEFVERMRGKKVNKKDILLLAISGAFDSLLFEEVDFFNILERYKVCENLLETGFYSQDYVDSIIDVEQRGKETYWAMKQRGLTGFYEIDFSKYLEEHTKFGDFADRIKTVSYILRKRNEKKLATIVGFVRNVDMRETKKGKVMYTVVVESNGEFVDYLFWVDGEEELEKKLATLNKGQLVLLRGLIKYDTYKLMNRLENHKNKTLLELL
jgi:DNA polymerase-3 subunit alpha